MFISGILHHLKTRAVDSCSSTTFNTVDGVASGSYHMHSSCKHGELIESLVVRFVWALYFPVHYFKKAKLISSLLLVQLAPIIPVFLSDLPN